MTAAPGLRPARSWPRHGRTALWYGGFAVHAGAVAVFSAGQDKVWGIWAVGAYAIAAVLAARPRVALAVAVLGALVAPVVWLHLTAPPTPDMQVVTRSAALLLRHGTPYLPNDQLTSVIAYNPYLPVMSVFGVAGDPRLWLTVATFALLTAAFRTAGRDWPAAAETGLFATASSVLAFPLTLGITDPPMLALLCLTAALLQRDRCSFGAAAAALGIACAMKATAWPALPVFAAMFGVRTGIRFAAAAATLAAGLVLAGAPAAVTHPSSLVQNTILFPLGLTHAQTPAASPLPGHLLASTGGGGHLAAIGLLVLAGLAVAVSLVTDPPADAAAAIRRLAIGLTIMFALAPATRFGYFAYPVGLFGWLVLHRTTETAATQESPDAQP